MGGFGWLLFEKKSSYLLSFCPGVFIKIDSVNIT